MRLGRHLRGRAVTVFIKGGLVTTMIILVGLGLMQPSPAPQMLQDEVNKILS
jgi:hypothetical protein